MEAVQVFFSQSWLAFRSLYSWLRLDAFIWIKVVQPLSALALFTLCARYVLNVTDVSYYVIGNALVACWTSAFAGITVMLNADRLRGTLPYLIISPTSRFLVFAGRAFFYLVDGLVTVLIVLGLGGLLFQMPFNNADFVSMAVAIIVGVFSVSCAGLLLGAFALLYRDINTIMNLSMSALLVFAGVNFPVSEFPPYIRWISHILPLSRALTAARSAYHGIGLAVTFPAILQELAIGLVYLFIGYFMFIIMERQARVHSTIDLY